MDLEVVEYQSDGDTAVRKAGEEDFGDDGLSDLEVDLEDLVVGGEKKKSPPKKDQKVNFVKATEFLQPKSDNLSDLDFEVEDLTEYKPPEPVKKPSPKADTSNVDYMKIGTVDFEALENTDTDLDLEIRKNFKESANKKSPSVPYQQSALKQDVRAAQARLAERGEKLNSLADTTETMAQNASEFSSTAKKLREKMEKKKWYHF